MRLCLRVRFEPQTIECSITKYIPSEKLQTAKPNMSVLKNYRKREEEFLHRADDLEKVTERRDAEKQKSDALCKRRLDEFMSGFSMISLKLKEMYQVRTSRVSLPVCAQLTRPR